MRNVRKAPSNILLMKTLNNIVKSHFFTSLFDGICRNGDIRTATTSQRDYGIQQCHLRSAPEKLTREGYDASTWTLLAEEATKTGKEITLPEAYKLSSL